MLEDTLFSRVIESVYSNSFVRQAVASFRICYYMFNLVEYIFVWFSLFVAEIVHRLLEPLRCARPSP